MKTYFTILYAPIRSIADEQVSVALLLRHENKVFFRFSNDKLGIIKDLMPDSAFKLLRAYLESFKEFFKNIKQQDNGLFPNNLSIPKLADSEYIAYLNRYSKSLLHFSLPKPLSIEPTEESFTKLYNIYIYDTDINLYQPELLSKEIKRIVNPQIKRFVNLDIELTSHEVENLVVPAHVWFIGQNKVEVTGEVFDFDKQNYYLQNDVSKHLNLIHAIKETTKAGSTHFVVGQEPHKYHRRNHSLWNTLRKLEGITYVPNGELDRITDYMITHQVLPFLSHNNDSDES